MIDQIRAIVREHQGRQLASDNGVFRFHSEEACRKACHKLNAELPSVKTFVTTDILVVTINDRFDEPSLGTSGNKPPDSEVGSVVPMPVWNHSRHRRSNQAVLTV
jgi:hypothetical protein